MAQSKTDSNESQTPFTVSVGSSGTNDPSHTKLDSLAAKLRAYSIQISSRKLRGDHEIHGHTGVADFVMWRLNYWAQAIETRNYDRVYDCWLIAKMNRVDTLPFEAEAYGLATNCLRQAIDILKDAHAR